MGDAQSAHNLGLRYLLRDEMVDEIALGQESDGRTDEQVLEQAKNRHESLWGVGADDVEASKWFQKAAELGEWIFSGSRLPDRHMLIHRAQGQFLL